MLKKLLSINKLMKLIQELVKENWFIVHQKFSYIYCMCCLFTPEAPLVQGVSNLSFDGTLDWRLLKLIINCHIYDSSGISVTVEVIYRKSFNEKNISITSRLFLMCIYFHSVLLTCDLKYKEVSSQWQLCYISLLLNFP